jgi:hypothetical protein
MKDHYNVLFLCTGNSAFGGARSGRQLHHCCILVHRVHFFRKPCCYGRTGYHRRLFRDSALDVPGFVLAQAAGATTATLLFHRLDRNS